MTKRNFLTYAIACMIMGLVMVFVTQTMMFLHPEPSVAVLAYFLFYLSYTIWLYNNWFGVD